MACSASSRVSLSASLLRAPCSCSARNEESAPTRRKAERFAAITTASGPPAMGGRSRYAAGSMKPALVPQARRQNATAEAAAPTEADGAADDGQRIEDGEDALRPAGQVDEAGGREHVGCDLEEPHHRQVPPGAEEEGGHQRGHVHAGDD